MSRYSSMTFSSCFCHADGPYLKGVATIFFLPRGWIIKKTNFLVLEMSLLHCFAVTKEITIVGGTYGIMYNLFPNVIITA